MIFKRKYKLVVEKEKLIHDFIVDFCSQPTTTIKIDPKTFNIFVLNNDLTVVLLSKQILISSSDFIFREDFNFSFLDLIREILNKKASEDRQKILDSILLKEKELINKLLC